MESLKNQHVYIMSDSESDSVSSDVYVMSDSESDSVFSDVYTMFDSDSDTDLGHENKLTFIHNNMSPNSDINIPTHKSTQIFRFTKHYEAKHAIGKKHVKRLEFENRPGISNIISACDTFYHTSENPIDYGRFIISGKIHAIDKLMIEIREYLNKCQNIYNDNYY